MNDYIDDEHYFKILNPNQRQLLEDQKRLKEKLNQLREGKSFSQNLTKKLKQN